jgi:hypothetical protein
MRVRQVLESANCGGIVGETVTLSCEIKVGANFSAASSAMTLTIEQGTGNDETSTKMATGFTGVVTTNATITATTSFVKYSVTTGVIGATISQLGVLIAAVPVGTAGADDWYEVRNIQLEVGATATEFEVRSVGNTLDLCQRYYQKAGANSIFRGNASITGVHYYWMPFSTEMRASPTMSVGSPSYSNATGAGWYNIATQGGELVVTISSAGGYAFIPWTATAEL